MCRVKREKTRTVLEGNALLSPVVDISACPVGLDWSRRKSVSKEHIEHATQLPLPTRLSYLNVYIPPTKIAATFPRRKTRCRRGALLRGARDPITQQWPSPVVGCCSWKSQVLVTRCCCASTVIFFCPQSHHTSSSSFTSFDQPASHQHQTQFAKVDRHRDDR